MSSFPISIGPQNYGELKIQQCLIETRHVIKDLEDFVHFQDLRPIESRLVDLNDLVMLPRNTQPPIEEEREKWRRLVYEAKALESKLVIMLMRLGYNTQSIPF
ncbi:hypothetical protein BGZ65_000918 [Modicella reniformis]|uniref:Uncharacterized protein n=1 Tax=Modicella reniformis TaxID=1440133 RepID=A0A9P6J2S0_9FUNG|nr:hypothetical protein BGZ65_000918 [Modicella reniformis]